MGGGGDGGGQRQGKVGTERNFAWGGRHTIQGVDDVCFGEPISLQ